jgi:hypothetical protein
MLDRTKSRLVIVEEKVNPSGDISEAIQNETQKEQKNECSLSKLWDSFR